MVTFENPQAHSQGQPGKQRRALAVVDLGEGVIPHNPREMSATSPPIQVGRDLFYHEWKSVMENLFILEMIWVVASLTFPVWPLLSVLCVPISLPHKGNPKRDAPMAEFQVMVAKGAVVSLTKDPGPGFLYNLFLVTKVTGASRQ